MRALAFRAAFRVMALLCAGLIALAPRAGAQSALPDLGSVGDLELSPQQERRLGESIVRDMRRDPQFIDDPELSEYLGTIGARLSQAMGARQDFEFFGVRDPTINAFALPGGFVGVHTGLLAAADTESELASVLAHELSHVTQRHIARMLGQQKQMQLPVLAAMAAALLLGRSRPDLAGGATAAVQAGAVSTQLSYSRDFERDADRTGLQALVAAGYDPRAMAAFFEKMQRSQRVSDDGTLPGYLRTHPVTTERIADAQNRVSALPYKQTPDSAEFHLIRAKLRAEGGDAQDTVTLFERAVNEKRYANEAAARYGLVSALLRARRAKAADVEMAKLRATAVSSPMIDALEARVRQANNDVAGAEKVLAQARTRYPTSRALLYAQVGVLQDASRNDRAIALLNDAVRNAPGDPRLRALQSRSYAALGKRLLQHQAQGEYYALQGSLPAAIEQLQLARGAGDGDFYQLSVVDARLKELRAQQSADNKR
ncbi:MAG TPA: M48 family metalloprotease [Burkholderiales bacterium]|jgi:predicted Zn-dependent protease|nr:M48 family metalloprotease [Burkholderiales bacterium]